MIDLNWIIKLKELTTKMLFTAKQEKEVLKYQLVESPGSFQKENQTRLLDHG